MRETYLRPKITDAGAVSAPEGLFPVVEALAKGHSAGRLVRKVFSGGISDANTACLVKRKEYID